MSKKEKTLKKVKKVLDKLKKICYNKEVVARVMMRNGSIAQLGEHLPYKQRVTGSIPVVSTIWLSSSEAEQQTVNLLVLSSNLSGYTL